MKTTTLLAALALAGAAAIPAYAENVMTPLPANAYINMNGLDWAWAYPLPESSGMSLAYQSQFGWRLPTANELAMAPLATDFLFRGANVPFFGVDPVSGATFQATNGAYTGDGACATPYFSNFYNHCDWQDGNGQTYQPWAGTPGAWSFADQLVVRAPVPEPETWLMLAGGLGLLGALARRRS